MRYININGNLVPSEETSLRPDNRAFRYGYSLFETMLMQDGRIRLEAYHWERLFAGIRLLEFQLPHGFKEELVRELASTVRRNGMEALCRIRLQVAGGHGGLHEGDDLPSFVIEAQELDPVVLQWNEAGLNVGISSAVKHTGSFAHLKTGSALPYAVAARQAKNAWWNDALLLNEHGNIADSTIANIFWTKAGKIYTPPLIDGCVAGVMRRHLLAELPSLGYEVAEQSLRPDEISSADGVFLCNAVRGLQWASSVAGHSFPAQVPREIRSKVLQFNN